MSVLRNTLRANAAYSLVTGTVALVFAQSLAETMSISEIVLYVVGAGVLLFGVGIFVFTRKRVDQLFAVGVILLDVLWVVGAITVIAIPGTLSSSWILAVVSLPVGMFAYLQARALRRTTEENPKTLTTSVAIEASPGDVWAQLTDLSAFSNWNPFITEASGRVELDGRLMVRMGTTKFAPTVTEVEENSSFEWLGHLGPRGLFDGRHRFDLQTTADGTLLTQSEEFTGVLVPLFAKSLDTKTHDGFVAMNQALKTRVESAVRNSV